MSEGEPPVRDAADGGGIRYSESMWEKRRGGRFRGLWRPVCGGVVLTCLVFGASGVLQAQSETAGQMRRLATLALDCVHREYPNKIAHVLVDDGDVRPPRELTPAFFGCFDWHSSVHGHWLLARLARLYREETFAEAARAALRRSLTVERIRGEVEYFQSPGRAAFERPYGVAWLLQLTSELREWAEPEATTWLAALAPLETAASQQIKAWLPKLTHPIRVGEHSQTAFAFGLLLDWAMRAPDPGMFELLRSRIDEYYGNDRDCPIDYEPSGQDFLSPCLAEADLLRRTLEPEAFASRLRQLLPGIPEDGDPAGWLEPAVVIDASDGKLAHLDGLNLSRAWMLEGIAAGLPSGDARRTALLVSSRQHREAGLAAVTGEHYEGGHWLGTFAIYLMTERGLR